MKWFRKAWRREKEKAAIFIKLAEKMGGKPILHQTMKLDWYMPIDKILQGRSKPKDGKKWKKLHKKFRREIVGVPSKETNELLSWLAEFHRRVEREEITKKDLKKWLPQIKSYMEACEENAFDNYIVKNKYLE